MASQLTNGPATAIQMYQALFGQAPSSALYTSYTTSISNTSSSLFAADLASGFALTSDAALALQVLTNVGITATTVTAAGSYATLLSALQAAFTGYGVASRGQIILNLTNLLANLEGDATYGVAATAFNAQTLADFSYAANTANTVSAVVAPTAATAGQTFTLTTGVDSFTGSTGNDTFTGTYDGAATSTFNVSDVLAGGSGTDVLNITASDDAVVTLPGALVSGIETVNIRNVDGNAGAEVLTVNASNFVGATTFNADRSTDSVTFSNLATGAAFGVIGNGTVAGGAVVAGYATTTDAVTLNIADGTKMANGVTITGTATTATINSTGAANTIGTVDLAQASLTSVTINAATNLKGDLLSQATDQVGTDGVVTISGAATTVELTAALDNTIKTITASGLTAGGVKATLGTGTTTFTGGTGVDTITLNTGVTSANFGAGNDVVTTADLADTLAAGVISGGDGTDTLTVAAAADVNLAAERAAYTSFETLNNAVAGTTLAADGFTGITALITSADNSGFSGMTAAQAAAITVTTNQTAAVTYALTTATGTSDVLTASLKSATATTSVDFLGATVTGFETVNLSADSGVVTAVGGATTDIGFAAAANLKNINISGAFGAFVDLANTAVAVTVASTQTGTAALGITGAVVKGSSITTTANVDNIATVTTAVAGVQGEYASYNAGAGNDTITTTLTALNNTNNALASLKIEGGAGTDTLTFVAADVSFADANFQYVTGVEKMTFASTTSLALTTGGFFDNNFKTSGVTLTAAGIANGSTASITASSFTGATTVALTSAADGASTADNITVTTGTAADTVTVTAASWVGGAATGALAVTTGAGADTISVSVGTLANATTANSVTINAGTGADVITVVGVNGDATAAAAVYFTIAAGDSTAAARDTITGFDIGSGALISSVLDFAGSAIAATATAGTNGTDSGTIKSHAIVAGLATFDDIDTYAAALVVNSTNLSDVLGYLAANITTSTHTVAFAYDSDASGTADATIVFNTNTAGNSVVELVGVLGTSLSATNAVTASLVAVG